MTTLAIDGSYALHRAKNVCITRAKETMTEAVASGQSEEDALNKAFDNVSMIEMTSVFFSILPAKFEMFYATRAYVLWDEGRCHYRVKLNPLYKVARTLKPKTEIDLKADKEFLRARQYLHTTLPSIGIASILVPGIEADDLGYYLSHTLPSGVLMSDDQDWFLNLSPTWELHRPMQKGDNVYNWQRFVDDTVPEKLRNDLSPRYVYLYEKALIGDKDEIPRITTKVPARNIAHYMTGIRDTISPKEKEIMLDNTDQIDTNVLLAETYWLIADPTIHDMPKLLNEVNDGVIVGNKQNFWQFAMDTNSFQYSSRWNQISKRLEYKS